MVSSCSCSAVVVKEGKEQEYRYSDENITYADPNVPEIWPFQSHSHSHPSHTPYRLFDYLEPKHQPQNANTYTATRWRHGM